MDTSWCCGTAGAARGPRDDMSEIAKQVRVSSPSGGASPATRVGRAAVAVPVAALAAGAAASAVDVRMGLGASAVVIGWTQLVGL
jgi:hypothetical protein